MTAPERFPPIALEVIATSVADAVAAESGGAARVELVSDLGRGGMTPPVELVDAVLAAVRIPVRVMVRETEVHEVSDAAVRARLVELAVELASRPVDGIVFGAVAEGGIDEPLVDAVVSAAARPITFHRAFEAVADPDLGIRQLADRAAVDLVLCDGGAGDWATRAGRIARWTRLAGGRPRVMPGGGLTDEAIGCLAPVREIRDLHVGRLVRSPATVDGGVSVEKVAALVGRVTALRFP